MTLPRANGEASAPCCAMMEILRSIHAQGPQSGAALAERMRGLPDALLVIEAMRGAGLIEEKKYGWHTTAAGKRELYGDRMRYITGKSLQQQAGYSLLAQLPPREKTK